MFDFLHNRNIWYPRIYDVIFLPELKDLSPFYNKWKLK